MAIPWTRYDATGNVFIAVSADYVGAGTPEEIGALARELCDHDSGVGAEGLLYFHESTVLDIFNRDGSNGEFSINGLRCAAKHAIERLECTDVNIAFFIQNSFVDVAPLTDEDGSVTHARVAVDAPVWDASRVPFRPPQGINWQFEYREGIDLDGVHCWVLSVGNPHMIVLVGETESVPDIRQLGAYFEHHESFPSRVNVSVLEIKDPHVVFVRTWERGVGLTACCGSACYAAVAAGIVADRLGDCVEVVTDGGVLDVDCSTVKKRDVLLRERPRQSRDVESAIVSGAVHRVDSGTWTGPREE